MLLIGSGATENLEEIMVSIQALAISMAALQLRATVQDRVGGRIYPTGSLVLTQGATPGQCTQVRASVKNYRLIVGPEDTAFKWNIKGTSSYEAKHISLSLWMHIYFTFGFIYFNICSIF